MFLGNVVFGLGSTKSLNLPMFTALRRFSILMTMVGEYFVLKKSPSTEVVISVLLMVGGALIAAYYDLAFDLYGYSMVLLNNLFTSLSGIYMKKASTSSKCNKMGVLFYNSLFSAVALLILFGFEHSYYVLSLSEDTTNSRADIGLKLNALDAAENNAAAVAIKSTIDEVMSFAHWTDWQFICLFSLAAIMGSVLNYSIFLCTTINSALTTAVIGCLKNVLTTYIGMLVLGDYVFHWINFFGLNVSIAGSLYYTYSTIFKGLAGFGDG